MRDISHFTRIYVATQPVDFRKQAHSLALVVQHELGLDALAERSLFAFTNRRREAVKLLYFDRTGYAMWWKTLEKEKFSWPRQTGSGPMLVAPRELKWLLEGIDLDNIKIHKNINIM